MPINTVTLLNVFGELLVRFAARELVDEDDGVISGGAGTETKLELQELEDHINYASFILAAGVSNHQPIDAWISEARNTVFCLEDQIAMYAIRGSSNSQLYRMKYDIGMLRVGKLTTRIMEYKTVGTEKGRMPVEVTRNPESLPQFSEMSPFIRRTQSIPDNEKIILNDRIKEIEEKIKDPRSVLFITGGQGSGKTTLMNDVYKSEKEKKDFNQFCWVDIPKTGGLVTLLKMVLQSMSSLNDLNVDCDSIHELNIINVVHDTFMDKYSLIVLDNMEDTSVLHSLMNILKDLKWKIICLTRRDVQEDDDKDVFCIPGLEPYDSFKLFLSTAFCNFDSTTILQRENFSTVRDGVLSEAIGWKDPNLAVAQLKPTVELLNKILTRCQNNPWNIWSIGKLLGTNPLAKWEKITETIDGMLINEKSDPPVQLEDAELADATIRHCFLYCLAFPQTSESETDEISRGIPTRKLIRMWEAEGYLQNSLRPSQEQKAEYLLEELIKKNLLVVKNRGFDGEVRKCSVNEHIRPLAEKMCEHQKFCKVVVEDAEEASSTSRMTKWYPINPNILIRKKKPLSGRYRMLAVHGDRGVKELSKTLRKDIRLRSVLHFDTGRKEHPELELTFRRTYMLLRTLELQGANVAKLPPNIDTLVCLRYLGLRWNTKLEDLPPTLQRLTHLMCLDIRDTSIRSLADVSQFEEMRHLYLSKSFRDHSVAVSEGLHSLVNLQTLSGVAYRESSKNMSFEKQISHLAKAGCLRKLSIKKTSVASPKDICDAINGINNLQSLAILCDRDGNDFDLHHLEIGKNLRKLKLGGPMGNFCDLGDKMHGITFLYLWDSRLSVDLLHTLQGLMNLLVLSLLNVSTNEQMICNDGGYKKLKRLSIISMENLNECKFYPGAMRNLEELVFAKCGNLKHLPEGLDKLGSLREVLLTNMLPEFCNDAKDKLKDKVYVLRDELSHDVPSRADTGGRS